MFDFKVTPDDGDAYTFTAGSRDCLAWERATKRSITELLDNRRITDLYRLAHIAARRLGLFTEDLPAFETGVEVELTDLSEDPDPTQPAL